MIRRALLSVSDKAGLIDFARALADLGVELLSTGGTQKALSAAGIPVTAVETYTGSPEVMGGRVKTLHPRVHGGLLARLGVDDADLERIGAAPIDLLVVNLYPFEQTLAKPDVTPPELVEMIDIGGPSMLRSAAKNHARVTVVVDPRDYELVLSELRTRNEISLTTRQTLAAKVFAETAAYDAAIANWMMQHLTESGPYPERLLLSLEKQYDLRYGENPHQTGAFYGDRAPGAASLAMAESVGAGGKELSFNNLVDVDAALEAVLEYASPAAVVVKHASPCGIATASSLRDAYLQARDADALSAFGGIVALNRPVDAETARLLSETFLECVVAPGFEPQALEVLLQKKALRLLKTGPLPENSLPGLVAKRVRGGFVVQSRDNTGPSEVRSGRVVTARQPSPEELEALTFAWSAVKHVRSNAIVLAQKSATGAVTVGIGGGQTARVTAVEQACSRAGDRAVGAVLASDAFFPFPDGVETAAKAGVRAIAQPGGSKKDDEVIRAADALGLAMVFTQVRHFRH